MKRRLFLPLLVFAAVTAQEESRPPLAEPSLAPDRPEVAFVSGGDIWTVPLSGGEARLLVSHPATESRPVYSPDGKRLAFTSTRTGNGDVYVLHLASGDLRRLTFHEGLERADNWSRDGKYVYFSSTRSDIAGMSDVFRVTADGGTPMQVSGDRYASEYFAAPSPAGDTLAITAKGMVSAQWWRNGHSHIDESEIWLRHEGSPAEYEQVTGGGAKSAWPMWSPDGRRLFFMSDRGGAENLWEKPLAAREARPVTAFSNGRVLWPSISADGRTVVFERDFGIWRADTASGKASAIAVALRGAPASPAPVRNLMTSNFRDLALSPDGRKVAFAVRGDVFAASAKDGGPATRLTDTPAVETDICWAPDNRRLVYRSDRNGHNQLFVYDLGRNSESQLTKSDESDGPGFWSPDGKRIAFVRNGRRLIVMDIGSGSETELVNGYFGRPPFGQPRSLVWSPDNRWIAYSVTGDRGFRNVSVVPAAGGASTRVSYVPNAYTGTLSWSPDGKYLLFDTRQRTETGKVARIDLVPRTPRFREDQFRELFREDPTRPPQPSQPQPAPAPASAASPASPAPVVESPKPATKDVQVVAEDIRHRVSLLPTGVDVFWQAISPDGKTLLMIAGSAGQTNLWTYSLDELAATPPVARQLTSTAGSKSDPWFTPDSKEVYYLEGGRLQAINIDTRVSRNIAITAEADVDFARDRNQVFQQAWSYLNWNFYDDKFHGVDWAAQRARVAPYVRGSRTPDELRRVLSLMIGELNSSHTGISGPGGTPVRTGNAGLRFDREEYERSGRLKIAEVIRLSPAAVAGLRAGQYLLAVDGKDLTASTSLDQLLEHKAGKRVELTVADSAEGSGKREVALSPVDGFQEKNLLYRHWVEDRRAYVHRISKGRLGYVHMPDMSSGSLDGLYMDLDTENLGREGVVVDIRNNNGGFVNAYALDVLARRPFLNLISRGMPAAPARSALGQRALERPTVLVVNQHSLSDAEDFTEGYRTLQLGKVVGEPTAGWIIYTGGAELIDGSVLRLPGTRVTDLKGQTMELNPRPVDVRVDRPVGESYTGTDVQLDTAVRELLKQVDAAKRSGSS